MFFKLYHNKKRRRSCFIKENDRKENDKKDKHNNQNKDNNLRAI
jgi:hypothetical protein